MTYSGAQTSGQIGGRLRSAQDGQAQVGRVGDHLCLGQVEIGPGALGRDPGVGPGVEAVEQLGDLVRVLRNGRQKRAGVRCQYVEGLLDGGEELCGLATQGLASPDGAAHPRGLVGDGFGRRRLIGQDLQNVRCGGGELVRHRNQHVQIGDDRGPEGEHLLKVSVGPDQIVSERCSVALDGTGQGSQGGIELSRMELDQQGVETPERRLQGSRLRRLQGGNGCAGT